MRTVLLFIPLFVCIGCHNKHNNADSTSASVYFPEITNEILKENIIEYVRTNRSGNVKNLIILGFSLSRGDTVVYTIRKALSMYAFIEPNVSSIIKMDSIYIGYRNLKSSDIEMPLNAVVEILSEHPSFKNDPEMYFRRKKRNKHSGGQNGDYEVFVAVIGRADIWTLKFLFGTLVSRSVYSGIDGSTRYF